MSMLTKKHRLSKKGIEKVKSSGRYFHTPFFTIAYLSGQKTSSQFAFVISKRVSKKATIRNKTKRLIAGSVRQLIIDLKDGYWVVFLVKPAALEQDKQVLAWEIEKSFEQINLLDKK